MERLRIQEWIITIHQEELQITALLKKGVISNLLVKSQETGMTQPLQEWKTLTQE